MPGYPEGHGDRTAANTDSNISKISVSGDVAGLIVTLVIVAIGWVGLPEVRWFLAAAIPFDLVIAVMLRLTARDR